jgi:hypothetical protein
MRGLPASSFSVTASAASVSPRRASVNARRTSANAPIESFGSGKTSPDAICAPAPR